MPFLHGVDKKDCYQYLAPDWNDMTIDEKIRWITAKAKHQAEYHRDPDLAYITNTKMVELIGSSMRNRISENSKQYKSEGFSVISEMIQLNGKSVFTWRRVGWKQVDELQTRMVL